MESAIQVDLARREAPASQVLDSALGTAAFGLNASNSTSAVAEDTHSDESSRRPPRIGYPTTNQIRLDSKASRNNEPSEVDQAGSTAPGIELGQVSDGRLAFKLPKVDEGFGAWSYVAGAFAMYIVVWGFPQAFPIFQTHLTAGRSATYPDSKIMALLAPGIQDILEGVLFQILPRAARYRRLIISSGITIMMLALFLASWADTAWQIVLTQGYLFGVGGVMLNFVHVSVFPEWFDKKRGQAMGIIWTGYRVGSVAFPLLCKWLLEKHGYSHALQVLAAPMLALLVPSVVLLRGRYSAATVISQPVQPRISKLAALRNPKVLYFLLVSVAWDFAINVPVMFITTFGNDLSLNPSDQALALSLHYLSGMVGTYGVGWFCDQLSPEELMSGLAISSSLVHFFLWGYCKTRLGLFIYALAIGLTSGGFDNSLFSLYSETSGNDGALFTAIHSVFSSVGGIGILSVGPVGMSLIKLSPMIEYSSYGIGKYKYLVWYVSSLTMASGTLIFLRTTHARICGRVVVNVYNWFRR